MNDRRLLDGNLFETCSRRLATACLAAFAALLAGCNPAVDANREPSLEPVTLQLNWFPEMEHGGFYAALIHGYYRDEGLEVTIKQGGARTPTVNEVATGRAEFAIGNADDLLLGRANGAEVTAIFSPLQDSPRCIMVHQDSGVRLLDELKGLRLAIKSGQPFEAWLRAKGKLEGVETVPFNGGVSFFLENPKHAQQGYTFSEPYVARQQGADPKCLLVSETGFNPYAGLMFASEDTVQARSKLVGKMVRASLRGWKKYLNDPETTNAHIHSLNEEMGLAALEFGAEALAPLCLPSELPAEDLGRMSADRWKTLASQLVEIKMLDPKKAAVDRAFTNEFLTSP
jgi:NitT/TauT family transport system substrate-binding protein